METILIWPTGSGYQLYFKQPVIPSPSDVVYNEDAVERGKTLQDGREKKSSKCGKQSKIQEKKVTLLTDKLTGRQKTLQFIEILWTHCFNSEDIFTGLSELFLFVTKF